MICNADEGDPVSADKQPVRVNAIGCAGDERTQIHAVIDLQCADVVRLDNENLVDFVSQHLVQHAEGEGIAVGELVKVGKELGGGQPSMRREGGMRPRFASRQACALNVTDGD